MGEAKNPGPAFHREWSSSEAARVRAPALVSPAGLLARKPNKECLVVLPQSRNLDEDLDDGAHAMEGAIPEGALSEGEGGGEMQAARDSLQPHPEQVLVRTSGGVLRIERGKPREEATPPGRSGLAADFLGAAGEALPLAQPPPEVAAHPLLQQAEAATLRQLQLEALAARQLGDLSAPATAGERSGCGDNTVDRPGPGGEPRGAARPQPEAVCSPAQLQPQLKRRKQEQPQEHPQGQLQSAKMEATSGPPGLQEGGMRCKSKSRSPGQEPQGAPSRAPREPWRPGCRPQCPGTPWGSGDTGIPPAAPQANHPTEAGVAVKADEGWIKIPTPPRAGGG